MPKWISMESTIKDIKYGTERVLTDALKGQRSLGATDMSGTIQSLIYDDIQIARKKKDKKLVKYLEGLDERVRKLDTTYP